MLPQDLLLYSRVHGSIPPFLFLNDNLILFSVAIATYKHPGRGPGDSEAKFPLGPLTASPIGSPVKRPAYDPHCVPCGPKMVN